MSRELMLRPAPSNRREPLLNGHRRSSSFAEVAGGTAAECVAVCCCCPCGLVNLLVLAIYKVPAGLCRRALKKSRRRRLMKKGLLQPRPSLNCRCGCDDLERQVHPVLGKVEGFNNLKATEESEQAERAVVELEKEMWERFYSTGFWRSSSQKE